MHEQELLRILQDGVELVRRAARDEIPFAQFVEQYGSFYYENILPDDESTESQREIGRRLRLWYEFHRDVQDVVNLTYTAPEGRKTSVLRTRLPGASITGARSYA